MGRIPAPWTAVRTTPNRSPRQNVPRKGVCLHHAAMTSLSGLRSLAMGGKQVSATAIVKDGEAENLVRDENRPWSLADAWGDSAFRSVETANESTNGWTISDASHWTLARLVAYWAEQDGFWPHRSGDPKTWTVIGHREFHDIYGGSYATACPGGMDLNLVTARAQALLGGTAPAGGGSTIINDNSEEDDMSIIITVTKDSADKKLKKGQTYVDPLNGPIVLLAGDELGAIKYFKRPIAEWSGDALRRVMKVRGRRPFDGTGKSDYTKIEH